MAELPSDHDTLESPTSYARSSDFNPLFYTPITSKKLPKRLFPDVYPQHGGQSYHTSTETSSPQHALSPKTYDAPPENNLSSTSIDVEELNRQIQVLQMEQDAMYQEVADLRRRLHLSQKDNQRLRKILINLGEKMIEEGHSDRL